jgi:hypothetical protein
MEIVVMTFLLSMSIIVMHLLAPNPDDTATLLSSLIYSVSRVRDPILSCPIWIISTPSLNHKYSKLWRNSC